MLNINPVVSVNVSIGTGAMDVSVLDVGAILVKDFSYSSEKRLRTYTSAAAAATGMAADGISSSSEAFRAAQKYFAASPTPKKLLVSCYANTETPIEALDALIQASTDFYGVAFADSRTQNEYLALYDHIAEINIPMMLFIPVTGTVSSVISSGALAAKMKGMEARRAIGMYCTSVSDASAFMGTAMGYAAKYGDSGFSLCYKKLTSMQTYTLNSTQMASLKAVNLNIAVPHRLNENARIEDGATFSGLRFDEVYYVDRLIAEIQSGICKILFTSSGKLPQTDSTSTLFLGEICSVLERYYASGILAEAKWRGSNVGTVKTGDVISHGYAAFVDSFETQSAADRAAHKSMPITVIVCLSGSVESIVINLDVQT